MKKKSRKLMSKDVLVENCKHSRSSLKRVLKREEILNYECNICNLTPTWNGKALSLQIDHINGVNNDNRISNIRWLCPNCHSQTDNFAGRALTGKKRTKDRICIDCDKVIYNYASRCMKHSRANREKITWPSNDELSRLVWEKPRSILSKELGVSDKAISKRCNKYEISQPPRGYWSKKAYAA